MIDFAPWNVLLQRYVDDRGRVDYAQWQQESAQALDRWLAAQQTVDLSALERETAIALHINLYNALTIQQVLQQYPINSIRPSFLGMPNWLAFLRFFNKSIFVLKGRALSLNAIEHDILRAEYQEPRIHFALVCASVGCPWLRSQAYLPETLDAQLSEDATRFINNPEKVRYEAESQRLDCSKIFQWYEADFVAAAGSVPAFVNRYRSEKLPPTVEITYLPYSWALNQRTSS